jgi:phospholipase/lecithinase/hemolysin
MTSFTVRAFALSKRWLFALLVAFGLLAGQASADGKRFHSIAVFGDSLSDPGNLYLLTGGRTVSAPTYGMDGVVPGTNPPLPEVVALIPELAYTSKRLSNGLTWIELLGAAMGRSSSVQPAVPGALIGADDGRAANYAVAGATAANVGVSQFPLDVQVDLFLGDVRGRARHDALHVVAIGGNDIRAALADPTVIGLAVDAVARNIRILHAAGARTFLIWNVPNLGGTPAFQRLNAVAPGIAQGATALSMLYNAELQARLSSLSGLQGIQLIQFNAFETLQDVQANPRRYGLADAASACIQPDVPHFGQDTDSPFRCAQPDRHLFWDGIHPTRAGHAIIAFLVGKELVKALAADD